MPSRECDSRRWPHRTAAPQVAGLLADSRTAFGRATGPAAPGDLRDDALNRSHPVRQGAAQSIEGPDADKKPAGAGRLAEHPGLHDYGWPHSTSRIDLSGNPAIRTAPLSPGATSALFRDSRFSSTQSVADELSTRIVAPWNLPIPVCFTEVYASDWPAAIRYLGVGTLVDKPNVEAAALMRQATTILQYCRSMTASQAGLGPEGSGWRSQASPIVDVRDDLRSGCCTPVLFSSGTYNVHRDLLEHRARSPMDNWRPSLFETGHCVPFLAIPPDRGAPNLRYGAQEILTQTLSTLADLLRDSLPHRTKLDSLGLLSALTGTAEQLPAVTSLVHSGHRGGLDIGEGHWKLLTFQCCGADRERRQLETRCVGPVRWHGGSCTIRRHPVQMPEVPCRGAGPCRGDHATPAQAPRLHWQPSASEITRALQAG